MEHGEHLDPRYVTGLCDGAAAFTFSRNGNSAPALYFAVKLTWSDRPLLVGLQAYFGGVGRIYDVKPRRAKANSGWTKKAAYYRVTHLDELHHIVEHFDAYPLLGRRSNVYAAWRSIYELRVAFRRQPMPDAQKRELGDLLERLSSLSPRNRRWDGHE